MVGLEDQGKALGAARLPRLEPLHHPVLPQRLGPVERLGGDPGRQQQQLLLATRGRKRGLAHVVVEVEAGVVDPQGAAGLERGSGQLLAIARDQLQAPPHVLQVVLEGGRRPLKHQHAADVHVRVIPFPMQECRVDRGQPVQVLLMRHRMPSLGAIVATKGTLTPRDVGFLNRACLSEQAGLDDQLRPGGDLAPGNAA